MATGQQRVRGLPVDAGIGDGDAVAHLALGLLAGLVALEQVGFEHDADDGAVALLDLVDDVVGHLGLQTMILAGVAVAAIHHQAGQQARFF